LEGKLTQGIDVCDLAEKLGAKRELLATVLNGEMKYEPNEGTSEGKEHCPHSEEILSFWPLPLTFREEIRVYNILMCQVNVCFSQKRGRTCQSFKILTILSTKASIRFPHPVPARGILASSSKKDNGIIRFN